MAPDRIACDESQRYAGDGLDHDGSRCEHEIRQHNISANCSNDPYIAGSVGPQEEVGYARAGAKQDGGGEDMSPLQPEEYAAHAAVDSTCVVMSQRANSDSKAESGSTLTQALAPTGTGSPRTSRSASIVAAMQGISGP